jgi:hypothetical protein
VEQTSLTLLTGEGPLDVTFRPMLTSDQYGALARFITANDLRRRKDFCDYFGQLAAEWGVRFETSAIED